MCAQVAREYEVTSATVGTPEIVQHGEGAGGEPTPASTVVLGKLMVRPWVTGH